MNIQNEYIIPQTIQRNDFVLTKLIANNIIIGTDEQTKATLRHDINDPSKKIKKYPIAAKVAADANKIPRIDVSLISNENHIQIQAI